MASETTTPNVGLQIPAYNQANWQVPTDYNWNLIDLIFGGQVTIPGISVENFIITNIGAQIALSTVKETPSGVVPGNVYTLSQTASLILGFYWNGIFQRPDIDYTQAGNALTLTNGATNGGDTVYVIYLT
jgi:hypothetical protein